MNKFLKRLDFTRRYRYREALLGRGHQWFVRAADITFALYDKYHNDICDTYKHAQKKCLDKLYDIVSLLPHYHDDADDLDQLRRLVNGISFCYKKYEEIIDIIDKSMQEELKIKKLKSDANETNS